jgi:uncharacterized membrane protein YgcG|nr:S8 family serine peptidase [Kofleriaceae bacterium]
MLKLGAACALLVVMVAMAATPARADDRRAACNGARRCLSYMKVDAAGRRVAPTFATPAANQLVEMTPSAIEAVYAIDTTVDPHATVAVIDAYGYSDLEADLASYRSMFGLPACTSASGCLTIVNQDGSASPLPGPPPDGDDWTFETALDVDMVSAACPLCKILVVEATDDLGTDDDLLVANDTAATLGAAVISNSWSSGENFSTKTEEAHLVHAGIAIFASTGDDGANKNGLYGLPSTSPHVIAVGGTSVVADPTQPRGFAETAWSDGGSYCSQAFAKPAFQTDSACAMRATADVSAVADGQVVVLNHGQLEIAFGTSAASPLVAAVFALTGHAADGPDFPYAHATDFNDVTGGSNGSCATALCQTGAGWDGPTGNGTPIAALLGGAALPAFGMTPGSGDTVAPGFTIDVTCAPTDAATVQEIDLGIDGAQLASSATAPFSKQVPASLADGTHQVFSRCVLSSGVVTGAIADVTQAADSGGSGSAGSGGSGGTRGGGSTGGGGGGCDTSGGGVPVAPLLLGVGIAVLSIARRRV